MSTPKIWYYPNVDRGALVEVDLLGPLSDLRELVGVEASTDRGFDGGVHWKTIAREESITLSLEGITSASLVRKLKAVEAHLLEGGSIGLANDPDKAWAGYTSGPLADTATVMDTRGNTWQYGTQNSSATFAAGDEVAIRGEDSLSELATVASLSGTRLTLASPGLVFDYRGRTPWLFVRHRDYWPSVRLPADHASPILFSDDRRISWTFEADLVLDIRAIRNLAGLSPGALGGTLQGYGRQYPNGRDKPYRGAR